MRSYIIGMGDSWIRGGGDSWIRGGDQGFEGGVGPLW